MAGEVFISYRRADAARARLLYERLKEHGVEAWYDAHVGAGEDWRETTAQALERAQIFVLLFSKAASQSNDIAKELAAATFSRKLVVPIRIEDIQPTGAFLYELASRNWINAYEDTEARLAEVAKSLAAVVKSGADSSTLPFDRGTAGKAGQTGLGRKGFLAIAAAVVMAAALGFIAIKGFSDAGAKPAASSQRVAVFGFDALGGDTALADMATATTDELFRTLDAERVDAAARTETIGTPPEQRFARASELGARYVLSGQLRADGADVVASIRLEDVGYRTMLWEEVLRGSGPTRSYLPLRVATAATTTTGCLAEMRASLKRDDLDVVRLLPRACRDANTPGTATVALLRELVRKAPDSAAVQSLFVSILGPTFRLSAPAAQEALRAEAEAAAARAAALDPHLARTHVAQYMVARWNGKSLAEQERLLKAGLTDAPDDRLLNIWYGALLRSVGRVDDSVPYLQMATTISPLSVGAKVQYATSLAMLGRKELAWEQLRESMTRAPTLVTWQNWMSAAVLEGAGDPGEVEALTPAGLVSPEELGCWRTIRAALKTTGKARKDRVGAVADCVANDSLSSNAFAVLQLFDLDRAFGLRRDMWRMFPNGLGVVFTPKAQETRMDPRFEQLTRDIGVLDYWLETGSRPDFCKTEPAPVCEKLRALKPH